MASTFGIINHAQNGLQCFRCHVKIFVVLSDRLAEYGSDVFVGNRLNVGIGLIRSRQANVFTDR
ncbi:hypothetical protein D3C87_1609910 [compost metagenome]